MIIQQTVIPNMVSTGPVVSEMKIEKVIVHRQYSQIDHNLYVISVFSFQISKLMHKIYWRRKSGWKTIIAQFVSIQIYAQDYLFLILSKYPSSFQIQSNLC